MVIFNYIYIILYYIILYYIIYICNLVYLIFGYEFSSEKASWALLPLQQYNILQFGFWKGISISFCFRYKHNDGGTFVVRGRTNPQGLKLFKFEWDSEGKAISIIQPTTGDFLGHVPGRWGPRSLFGQAWHPHPQKEN